MKETTLYKQVTCIDLWDESMGSMSNAEYFRPLYNNIIQGNAKAVVDDMKDWSESNLDPVTYEEISNGTANNSGERIVFDDLTKYILTAHDASITLYSKLTDQELADWNEQN